MRVRKRRCAKVQKGVGLQAGVFYLMSVVQLRESDIIVAWTDNGGDGRATERRKRVRC